MQRQEDWNEDALMGRVAFRNTDAHGWMHNTQYAEVCEDARMHWLRNRGASQKELQERGLILALKKADEEFFAGAQLEELIAATTKLVKIGKSSMIFEHNFYCENPLTGGWVLAVNMKLVLVCVDAQTGKSCPIPDDVKAKLLPYVEAPSLAIQAEPPKAKAAVPYDIEIEHWL